tara:strand:- start:175 stop:1107 length:933 start_codon:yes stop_codon:yes gene_type:complete
MFKVAALYKFSEIDNPLEVQMSMKKILKKLSIFGTILVGCEGINGTITAKNERNLNKALTYIKNLKGFKDLDIKFSDSIKNPFVRLKVKLKQEIVTIGDKSIDPTKSVGVYVNPEDWNSLLEEENILIIDTRNDYEYSIGSFKDSINPKTQKFRDFPKWLKDQDFTHEDKKNKKVAMFCTGGIRCEKASSLMKNVGFKKVYHLKGGILKYFESVSKEKSLWNGECFVFDDRVSVKHDLSVGDYDMCHGCRMPITETDKTSQKYIRGVSCPNCYDQTTEEQKSRYMNRQKQIELAKQRNQRHIGPKEELFN